MKEADFVCEAILKMNCIEELSEVPNIVNPLSVSIQLPGMKRLILDLRYVNLFAYKQKFKCDDLRVALSIISRGFSLFLKSENPQIGVQSSRDFFRAPEVLSF